MNNNQESACWALSDKVVRQLKSQAYVLWHCWGIAAVYHFCRGGADACSTGISLQ